MEIKIADPITHFSGPLYGIIGADVNQKLFRDITTTAAVRDGHLEILEVLLKVGASRPACEEALLEASYHGRARLTELLMGSDLIRPCIVVLALVTACCRGFMDVVDALLKGFFSVPVHYPGTVLGQFATSISDLSYLLQSTKGITSHSSTLTPARRILAKTIDSVSPATGDVPTLEDFTSKLPFQIQVSNNPVASLTSPSKHVKITPSHTRTPGLAKRGKIMENTNNSESVASEDLSIPTTIGLHDIEKSTSELHQSQGLEKLHPGESPDNLYQKDDPIQSHSLKLSDMAAMLNDDSSDPDEVGSVLDCTLVTVNGYRVKKEFASLLRDIFSKYGDIANCSSLQSMRSRSSFLEMACGIFQNLNRTKFTEITFTELKTMLDLITDIEFVKLEVRWLHKRLDEIYEAKLLFKGSSSLKEAKTRNSEVIEQMEKEVEGYKAEMVMLQEKISLAEGKLAAMKVESQKINGTSLEMKTKVKCFYQRSLVDGLL